MATSGAWSPVEKRIFTAVVAAAVGEPAGDDVADAAAPFLAYLSRVDRLRLRALLLGLEYGAPLFRLRPGRFTSLSPAEREAYLASWARSRLAPRRQGAAVLRALASLAYYGRDAAWPDVGYDGPWLGRVEVPVVRASAWERAVSRTQGASPGARAGGVATNEPAASDAASPNHPGGLTPVGSAAVPRTPLTLGRDVASDLHLRADAVVVGLGAGGCAALARLSELGVDAIGIEAGGAPTAAEYTQRELEMLPLLYHDAGLRSTADKAITILQGRGVGGSTLHNTGMVYRPPEGIVARWREEHGLDLSDAELERHVGDVLETLGAVPIPPERINANNDILRRGAERLGWRWRTSY
ncbi:MAG TPA: GMC family oxidoreductase N-terminal domain-containing protein, partial [Nannocystis sp.]